MIKDVIIRKYNGMLASLNCQGVNYRRTTLIEGRASRIRGRIHSVAPGDLRIGAGNGFKIIAVSPFEIATGQEILRFLATLPKALIVLPGNYRNTPSPHQIQRAIRRGSVAFTEGPGCPFLITRHRALLLPPQIFANAPSAQEMERLVRTLPQRTISIGNRGDKCIPNPMSLLRVQRKHGLVRLSDENRRCHKLAPFVRFFGSR